MGLATGTRGENVVFRSDERPDLVALTIDDAPSRSAEQFSKLLDVLRGLDVRVTFQVISGHASTDEHTRLLRRAVAEGHQLTNHSTEDAPCTGLSEAEFEQRLDECQAFLDGVIPAAADSGRRWFRPPSGIMNATMRAVLLRKGYCVCLGDCYSNDPHIDDASYHVDTLLLAATGGSVIIVHCPEAECRQQTLDVVPELVAGLRKRNLSLVTLDELFG